MKHLKFVPLYNEYICMCAYEVHLNMKSQVYAAMTPRKRSSNSKYACGFWNREIQQPKKHCFRN